MVLICVRETIVDGVKCIFATFVDGNNCAPEEQKQKNEQVSNVVHNEQNYKSECFVHTIPKYRSNGQIAVACFIQTNVAILNRCLFCTFNFHTIIGITCIL